MMEHAIYSILSPEGYSSILWKDSTRYKESAEKMKLTAKDLYDLKIIEIALKKTTAKTNPSFDYIDKLISSWHERNLKTPESIEKFILDSKQKNKDIKSFEKKNGYNNYNQRSYDDFSNLYANNSVSI